MKKVLLPVLALVLVACGSATTNSGSKVNDADQSSAFQYPTLPVLGFPKITVVPGPEMAAVQPYTKLNFTYHSCAQRNFDVKTQSVNTFSGRVTYIQVNEILGVDCMGPTIERSYEVQVSSDSMADGQYILSNPSMIGSN